MFFKLLNCHLIAFHLTFSLRAREMLMQMKYAEKSILDSKNFRSNLINNLYILKKKECPG